MSSPFNNNNNNNNAGRDRADFDPRLPGPVDDYDYEEAYPKPDYDPTQTDLILLSVRICVIVFFLICYGLMLAAVVRGSRFKSWRLYAFVALAMLCWLGLSLYQDHLDEYYVHEIYRFPQRRSIYWCFRNLVHGLTLYLILLLLSHLSDFQHRGSWLLFVSAVVLVPLVYALAVLVLDLRVLPEDRYTWQFNVAVATARTLLYNVVTLVLLIVFSPRFCTGRLYGTYEERRNPSVILLSRWTFTFYFAHNVLSIVSYALGVVARVPGASDDVQYVTEVQRCVDEAALWLAVLAVPVSYLVAVCFAGGCPCCGNRDQADFEMDKMDKIYQEVWTTGGDQPRKGRQYSVNPNPIPGSTPRATSAASGGTGLQNGSKLSLANSTTASTVSYNDPEDARRRQNASDIAAEVSRRSSNGVSKDDDVAPLPELSKAAKRKKRQSYMEAVSMGSLNDDRASVTSSSHSYTSEPVDQKRKMSLLI